MNVVIRTDASRVIGTGHVIRCLTLAEVLRDRGAKIHFICRLHEGHLCDLIEQHGFTTTRLDAKSSNLQPENIPIHSDRHGATWQYDVQETIAAIATLDGRIQWIIVDHYALDSRWEAAMRGHSAHIMVIDDMANRSHDCDLLLDQNLFADMEERYIGKIPSHCQALLGPRYALLRKEFLQFRSSTQPKTGPVSRVLVFFGGVDIDNYTGVVIDALAALQKQDLHVDVVIGTQHPCRAEIEVDCRRYGYQCHVQTPHMAKLMAEADLAIGAGGVANWERCCLGVPALVLCIAKNQYRPIVEAAKAGLLYGPDIEHANKDDISRHIKTLIENSGLRYFLSKNGLSTVDGRGAWRVARRIVEGDIVIRQATESDADNLFSWRNHPSIRAVSRNSKPISMEDHRFWLSTVLADPYRKLLIGVRANQPVGVVRFDIGEQKAEISIYLVPGLSEPGLGQELLQKAERWLADNCSGIRFIQAEVMNDNIPSHRLFCSSGYKVESTCYLKQVRDHD